MSFKFLMFPIPVRRGDSCSDCGPWVTAPYADSLKYDRALNVAGKTVVAGIGRTCGGG